MCALARVSAAPRHSGLGCRVVCVPVCAPRLHPATPGWGVRCGCVCFGSGFRLHPATPGWGFGVCVCLCACSACTLPLPAGVCGVGVCVWTRVSAALCHSWLGCWGLCLLVCAPRLHPATPGWGVRCGCVCLASGLGCAPPLLAGVSGLLSACVRTPLAARHSWLGVRCGCVCLGFGFGCAPPRLAVVLWCACLCACFPSTPPLLAGARGVVVCVWVRVSAAPRHSWLGCWDVWMLVWALPLYPATPGWGVRCGCGFLGSGFGCAPPLLARPCGVGVCVWAGVLTAPLLAGVLGCACFCACSPVTPPLLAGVCCVGVFARVRVSATPRHSWLGRWGVCMLVCALCLYPATPGWGVRCRSRCFGSGFGCPPPLLAGVLGCVCAGVRAPSVPRHSSLGCALWVCGLDLWVWLRPATPGWGLWCVGGLSPGTCSCAMVCCVLCALPGFAAPGSRRCSAPSLVPWLWPADRLSGVPRGPALVRRASCGPVALGAPVSFPHPGSLRPWLYWVAARGTRRPAENRAHCACHWPPPGSLGDGVVPGGSLWRSFWAACAAVLCVRGPGH